MNLDLQKLGKIMAGLLLAVLIIGPIACSVTFGQHWMHNSLGNLPCVIISLINSWQATSPEYILIYLGWSALLGAVILAKSIYLLIQDRTRLPAALFWPYNFWQLPRNYILLALEQGILHARVY